MQNDEGRSLFFLILSFLCLWLVLDLLYGNALLKQLTLNIFGESQGLTEKDQKEYNTGIDREAGTIAGK